MSAIRTVGVLPAVDRPTGYLTPLVLLAAGVSLLVAAPTAHSAQGPVALGTADSFAVLAGTGITNTGPTRIVGDVGTFPTPSETGFESVTLTGTNHRGDAVTRVAKDDLVTAYDDAAGRTPWTSTGVELGGSTLPAGVYRGGTFGLTGTLTLDARGDESAVFIFQAASTVITASNSRVVLINGADPCRVVWQVGSSATFNTGTRFVGDVLALTSITAQSGATFQGRLLARNGAVTMDTNTITRSSCATQAPAGSAPASPTPASPTPASSAPASSAPAPVTTGSSAPVSGPPASTPAAPAPSASGPPVPGGSGPAAPPSTSSTSPLAGPAAPPDHPARTAPDTPGLSRPESPGLTSTDGPGRTPVDRPGLTPGPAGTTPGPAGTTPVRPPAEPRSAPFPPSFPVTGANSLGLLGVALALLAGGAIALRAGRRRAHAAPVARG